MSRAVSLAVVAVLAGACRCPTPARPAAAPGAPPGCAGRSVTALRADGPLSLDGKLHEPGWVATPSSGTFQDARSPGDVVPHSEARLLWDDAALYVGLYGADLDLRPDDAMGVVLALPQQPGASLGWTVSPTSATRCSAAGGASCERAGRVTVAVDADGTVDRPGDDDEEWMVEIAIPWGVLGLDRAPARLALNFSRHDVPPGSRARDLLWSVACGPGPSGSMSLRAGPVPSDAGAE